MWRIDGIPTRVAPGKMALETRLEDIVEAETDILGQTMLIIGRQVPTKYGKYVDLLGVNADGDVIIIELKRDKTPRDVVAQVLDYASWVQYLSNNDVREIYEEYQRTQETSRSFDEAFDAVFGESAPEELNTRHELVVVASDMDDATERLVGYLSGGYNVPINVLLLDYFRDGDREYLARTWLIDDATVAATRTGSTNLGGKQAQWNGHDWFVSFGEESGGRAWSDAKQYGFVSAGGKTWFSRTLRQLPVGGRVFTHVPKNGYVGVGEVIGEAQPFETATVEYNGDTTRLADLPLRGNYSFQASDQDPSQDYREWVVPVQWIATVDVKEAFWKSGLFANQNSACRLKFDFTITEVTKHFDID
ncbi:hypothetical protein ASG12_07695 [Williamsia sp. Leaf354]|nr:hypothetical protein ASG12_07695 [Williamsia sp. Leaf354]